VPSHPETDLDAQNPPMWLVVGLYVGRVEDKARRRNGVRRVVAPDMRRSNFEQPGRLKDGKT